MKLFNYLLSAGLVLALGATTWADEPAKPVVPADKPAEAAKSKAKKAKSEPKAKTAPKAKGEKKARAKRPRPVLVQSLDKGVLVVKPVSRSKKAAVSETKYTINDATKIMMVDRSQKRAKGQRGLPTKAATRDDLKQGTKVVVAAKGDVAEAVTIMPTKTKKAAAKKAPRAKKKAAL